MTPTTDRDRGRLDAALRELDPAGPRDLRPDEERARVEALVARTVGTPPAPTTPGPAPEAPRRRAPWLLPTAGLVAAASAVAAVVVALPVLTGGDEAFAGWSPVPVALTGDERDAAVEACVTRQSDDGELAAAAGAEVTVLVAEARGGWSYVVYRTAAADGGRLEGSCLMPDAVVADPDRDDGGWFGSLGPAQDALTPPRRPGALREDASGVGEVDEGVFGFASGTVGPDVAQVFVDLADGRRVEASVEGGRWAAWWPAGPDGFREASVTDAWTYAVALPDGTERVVDPG